MLINLTNHPLDKWDTQQQELAEKIYSKIVDIPFPNIPPNADEIFVENLANEYLQKILEYKPQAVHVQGEFTFTYKIVSLLREQNIKCIASTTKRIVVENGDGSRTYQFEFVQFREYR